jgi:Ring finger domain
MLLLASILGEVKPPVASKEEIDAAGGISKISEEVKIQEGDRCLVCLSEYEVGEECRTLSACGHFFHRDCIDQVSKIVNIILIYSG